MSVWRASEMAYLVIALVFVMGITCIAKPDVPAAMQAAYYRKWFGIEAGPIGGGTRLYYRCIGCFVIAVLLFITLQISKS
jgi:hypothetical protein